MVYSRSQRMLGMELNLVMIFTKICYGSFAIKEKKKKINKKKRVNSSVHACYIIMNIYYFFSPSQTPTCL